MSVELKELQTEIQKSFEQLKDIGKRHDDELKAHGEATAETKTIMQKINTEMDGLKTRLDSIETKANRSGFGGGAGGNEDPQAEQKMAAFMTYVKEGKAGMTKEQKALVEDATGEIIVPYDVDNVLYRALPKLTVVRGLSSVRTTGSNRIRRKSMTEVTVGWGKLETTAAKLSDFESTPVPSDAYIYVEDALGLVKIGEDELEDNELDLPGFLSDSFGQAYASLEDLAFMKGTGHANGQPDGILNGTTVSRFDTAATATFAVNDLIKLYYAVPTQYRRNGTFMVHSLIEQTVRLAQGSDGQYLWQPSLQAGAPNLFNGRPIVTQDDLDSVTTAGKEIAVFGDFKAGYQIVDRKGSVITRMNELYAEDGLIGFRYKRRTGGGVVRPAALKILRAKA